MFQLNEVVRRHNWTAGLQMCARTSSLTLAKVADFRCESRQDALITVGDKLLVTPCKFLDTCLLCPCYHKIQL